VEVPAAIIARFQRGLLTVERLDEALKLGSLILDPIPLLGLTAAVRREAVGICHRQLIPALDAIHVGTAAVARRQQRRRGNEVRFLTADQRQGQAAISLFDAAAVTLLPPLG
jgi:predicted nucleic acid-binding protein